MTHLEPAALERFAAEIRMHRGKRIRAHDIWAAFAGAFPHRPQGPEEREWLRSALDALLERGAITYPAERPANWDRTMEPAIPMVVTRIDAPEARDESWRRQPWHPRLRWVPDLARLSDEQVALLRRIHEGLVNGRFEAPAPLRYRSLQLTGDDKRLERHMGSSVLFGEGRLNAEMLGIYTVVLPLAWERVAEGGRVLVFENKEPFIVARTAIAGLDSPPYDIVAYGGGRGFEQSVAHLRTIGCEITRIDYVGDLDARGLEIAQNARATTQRIADLPELRAAPGFHAMMLEAAEGFGCRAGWPDEKWTGYVRPGAANHLPADLRGEVMNIIGSGRRIPEEVLGPVEMAEALANTMCTGEP
jgi:hypothetical protein